MVKAVKGVYLGIYLFPYPPIHPLIDLSYTASGLAAIFAGRGSTGGPVASYVYPP